MNDEQLRKQVRRLKAFQQITYKEIAELNDIKISSFYAWLQGHYDFSAERKEHLQSVIYDLYLDE